MLFGALAVRVELWAEEGFKWALEQRGGTVCVPCAGGGDKAYHPLRLEEILLQMEVTGPCLACGLPLVIEDIVWLPFPKL